MSGTNNGNGGDIGIKPWTNKYQVTISLLLNLLHEPSHSLKINHSTVIDSYFDRLIDMGVVTKCGNTYTLIPDELSKISAVVSDELYDNFMDINWLREQRNKLGLIKGKVKGEEFRRGQQERRRKRRAKAREQKLARLSKPPEELNLADIVFYEKKKEE